LFAKESGASLAAAPVDGILVTNTISISAERSTPFADRLQVVDVSGIFAEAIRRCHDGGSINQLLGYAGR